MLDGFSGLKLKLHKYNKNMKTKDEIIDDELSIKILEYLQENTYAKEYIKDAMTEHSKEILNELENDIKMMQEKKCFINPNNVVKDILDLIYYYKNQ